MKIYLLFACNQWKERSSMSLIMATTKQNKLDAQIREELKSNSMEFAGYKGSEAYDKFLEEISKYNKGADLNPYNNIEYGYVEIVEDGEVR